MRSIDDFIGANFLMEQYNIGCRVVERLRIGVPELDNTEPLLGAHRHTNNRVGGGVAARAVEGSSCEIALVDFSGVPATHFEAIAAAANIRAILPHRRGLAAHAEHHAVRKLMRTDLTNQSTKSLPAINTVDTLVAVGGPRFVLWLVKV